MALRGSLREHHKKILARNTIHETLQAKLGKKCSHITDIMDYDPIGAKFCILSNSRNFYLKLFGI